MIKRIFQWVNVTKFQSQQNQYFNSKNINNFAISKAKSRQKYIAKN